jgi:hypothetical protein
MSRSGLAPGKTFPNIQIKILISESTEKLLILAFYLPFNIKYLANAIAIRGQETKVARAGSTIVRIVIDHQQR